MILYLDTSALIKLYVNEEHSDDVQKAAVAAASLASSVLAYVETCAALSRLRREKALSGPQHERTRERFTADWGDLRRVEATEAQLARAAELAEAFALRAYDSVHLAAADYLARAAGEPLLFACYDAALNKAARILGLSLLRSHAG
ncbi:MAG: type II toxin-antitoxin system VapC family toxin [Gammaproteobacteria bacterium]